MKIAFRQLYCLPISLGVAAFVVGIFACVAGVITLGGFGLTAFTSVRLDQRVKSDISDANANIVKYNANYRGWNNITCKIVFEDGVEVIFGKNTTVIDEV